MKVLLRLQSVVSTWLCVVCLLALILMVGVQSVSAQNISGSIQTSLSDGTTVNANLMPSKVAAYLNGGPQNENSAGLPVGTYYFEVTDPNGSVLLSTDDVTCRQVIVALGTSGKGVIQGHPSGAPPASCTEPAGSATPGAFHNNGSMDAANGGSIPIQLCAPTGCPAGSPDFLDTPNPGGEYKVWLISVDDYNACGKAPSSKNNFCFQNGNTKTDNFKVQPPSNIRVCKFNDENDDASQNNGEPLIPHWPITATGVNGGTVNAQTDDSGCISFSVTSFTNNDGTQTVTLTEGTQGPGWTQTAPQDGACTLTGASVNPADTCSVSGGVITLTVSPGETLSTPNFGNFNPNDCGTGCSVEPPVVTKTANPSFTRTFTWGISKSVDNTLIDTSSSATFNYTVNVTHDSGTDSGWQATGSIRVSNPNSSDMTNVTVTDAVDNGGNCTVDSTGFSGTIPANSHFDFPYTCTYGSLPSPGTNTATASSDDGQGQGTASVDFANATINITDGSVTVTDTFGGSLGTVSYTDPSPKTFTYSHTFTDPAGTCTTHNNTATFTTSDTSSTGSASQSVKVCVGADLTVSKTAIPAFNSGITKSVDKTLVEQSGGTITFNYTVKVTTSGWTVSGNITVVNPNDWESITATVGDVLTDSGGNCVVNAGNNSVSVGPSSSQVLPYSCTFSSVPTSNAGTNTAAATWNAATAFTPHSSAAGTAAYAFGSLTVTDSFKGTLGTVTIPPGSGTFTYSRTVNNSAPGTCTSYPNTATITQTGQSASQNVTVCNTNTGALTMGFWQNKNGQGIITSFCGGTSGTNLNAFLTSFNPFKDLTATTCSGEATYVSNVIKAASCTSSSNTCNAMLKAQMLSTALDVYFSTPTLGGNRIGAFNGLGSSTPALGGVAIDLSKVCAMIDGSSGGACSGTTEDARPEFGISSPALGTTVLQMLGYSNFLSGVNGSPNGSAVSNTGGSVWYNNVKNPKQVFAKDAFDAINNQVALIAPATPASNIGSPSF